MLLFMEGIVMCFVMLIICVIGIANGPEKYVVFYEKNVQEKAIEMGYTTKETIKKQTIVSILALYIPCFVLVPVMVCYVNGAVGFGEIFLQSLTILYIRGIFDRFFIDEYWVEHTKAWTIPGTEDMRPYIPRKTKIFKWFGMIAGDALIALMIAGAMNCLI